MKRDFLTLRDVSKEEIAALIRRALELKPLVKKGICPKPLKDKTLALVFEKSSTRTRVSFEVGMSLLGGHAIYLNQDMSQLGRGESYADTARVLSRYVGLIVVRTFSHAILEEIARHSDVPVINGLTDAFHPCQVLADLVTLTENQFNLSSMVVSYVGDGNNMAHSWMNAAHLLGFELRVACPKGYEVDKKIKAALPKTARILYTNDPVKAVCGAQAINADTWFSMGQKVSPAKRKAFQKFQINAALLRHAETKALVLHCLPAHRGEEITDDVMDGPRSVVFDQAENRLYAQMAIMEMLTGC